jgi:hypothetical protein
VVRGQQQPIRRLLAFRRTNLAANNKRDRDRVRQSVDGFAVCRPRNPNGAEAHRKLGASCLAARYGWQLHVRLRRGCPHAKTANRHLPTAGPARRARAFLCRLVCGRNIRKYRLPGPPPLSHRPRQQDGAPRRSLPHQATGGCPCRQNRALCGLLSIRVNAGPKARKDDGDTGSVVLGSSCASSCILSFLLERSSGVRLERLFPRPGLPSGGRSARRLSNARQRHRSHAPAWRGATV